jgi:hypothetical protein
MIGIIVGGIVFLLIVIAIIIILIKRKTRRGYQTIPSNKPTKTIKETLNR